MHPGLHADDLRMRVLRDLPDHRLAVGVRHPVARLDALILLDGLGERPLAVREIGHEKPPWLCPLGPTPVARAPVQPVTTPPT